MRGFHDKYFEEVTQTVAAVEEKSTAEIVVAVEPWSGNYRDVDFAVGAGAAFVLLLAVVFTPWDHEYLWIVMDAVLLFALGTWVSSALPAVRRALTRPQRREAQVRAAAAAAFHEEEVWTTRARTGILIYVSLLERQVVVLADRGITEAVAAHAWNDGVERLRRIREHPEPSKALLEGLNALGEALSRVLPPTEDNPDELPNRPRSRR